ncbi:secreted RxLR effector protein 161-like [Lathyrus oleraceus]|uniref:secreted RxLR effector protein 161-like n=1 Tax=Pisum sativum TaxID=3888 RepID=UPI0021CF8FCA|nr:secreted RxLR effector protein 161-like [Pisum sativum]
MVVRSLDMEKDPFRPREKDEELFGPEVPYLNEIGALMYLANYTHPDISFAVNLLTRYISSLIRRHWNEVKHILHYLRGRIGMSLFYTKVSKFELTGYADAYYLSDPYNGRSQIGYLFTCSGTTISWRSVKQTISATSSNHAELLALHEMNARGEPINDLQKIEKMLRSMATSFDYIVVYIEWSKSLAEMKLEELQASSEAHEMRLKQRNSQKEKVAEQALQARFIKKFGKEKAKLRNNLANDEN